MFLNKMAEMEKKELKFPVLFHLVAGEFNIRWQHFTFYLYTLFSCVKIVQYRWYVGLSALGLPSME